MAIMQIGIGLGFIIGPLLATVLLKIGGFSLPFYTCSGIQAFMFIFGLFCVPNKLS